MPRSGRAVPCTEPMSQVAGIAPAISWDELLDFTSDSARADVPAARSQVVPLGILELECRLLEGSTPDMGRC